MNVEIDLGGIIWLALLIFGLAGVAGGLVLYRLSRRVGWRAVGMSAAAAGAAALLVLPLTIVGSTDGEAPDPVISTQTIAPQPESSGIVLQGPGPAVGAGMLVPRANNVEELVARSQVIVLGTVDTAEEKNIGPYGADGKLMAAGEDGMPVTDYQVRIENVLKGDGHVEQGPGFVFRMFGHQNSPSGTVSSVAFDHPRVGQRLLFALGTNPDGTYGSGPEGLLNVDGAAVSYADGIPFGIEVAPGPFIQKIKQVSSLGGAKSTGGPAIEAAYAEPDWLMDSAWARVTVLSVEADFANMRIEEIRGYKRIPDATYAKLGIGDEVPVRVSNVAPLLAHRAGNAPMQATREGEAPAEAPKPGLVAGEHYLASMTICLTGFIDGLGCPYDGWSAELYPLQQPAPSVAPLTPGLTQPPVLSGSPVPSLKFDGVDYVHDGYAELPLGEGTVFVIDGTRVKVDELEVVGTTNEGNTPGIQDGLAVYRLQGAESSEVYTLNPGKDVVNPEDGQVFKGRDSWTRWTESRTPRGS